ncbi:MAG TPA: hypothetical protein VKB68_10335 [Stellaceae bacterium]|nr:hypothetical protein [Stellaceae bacterium]
MRDGSRRWSGARLAALALGLILAACAETPSAGVSAPIGPGASERICARLGFAPGSPALAQCLTKVDGLTRQQAESQKQCEGIRQRRLNTPFPSGGIGNTIATSDADYESCMSGQLIPPAQLPLPAGRTATCRVLRQDIACD